MERSWLEGLGYIRRDIPAGEERLRIACWNDVQLSLVVQLTNGEERIPSGRWPECKGTFEFVALCLCRTSACQEPMRVLPGDAELAGQICHREALTP
jgi:hypothetical protein